MSISPLADLSLSKVTERLEGHGSSLEGENREAIHALLKILEDGLNGTLDYGYYLSSIDPGIGKSLSVSTFLQVWKEQGFCPSSSVLIGLSRLEEIESYLKNSLLTQDEVAVLTSDSDRNALGLPKERHGEARVMFTTQQMIERRTRGRMFAEASEFHYRGSPRSLRIWDESFIPAEGLTLKVDDLARLPAALRLNHPEYVKELQGLITKLWSEESTKLLTVPKELEMPIDWTPKGQAVSDMVDALDRLSGSPMTVINADNGDIRLAGSSPAMPSDFAPLVILDASGRTRTTYDVWEANGAPLHRLPAAVKNYENLHVNLWERTVGKIALRQPKVREEIVEAIAAAIQGHLASSWLIVSYKDQPIEDELRKALPKEPDGGLHFLTWGMHHGTNAYAHCRNVVLVGQLTYGVSGYTALTLASGGPSSISPEEAEGLLKAGEYQHNWLQALTRASVRNSRGSLAGNCTAYLIASPGISARALIEEAFPRCSVDTWSPDLSRLTGQAGVLVNLLEEALTSGRIPIGKKELREALKIKAPNFSRLFDNPAVQSFMDRSGLVVERFKVGKTTGFEPWEGEGFSIEELEGAE